MASTDPIPRRPLGPGGPLVPPLALGSWNTWDRMTPHQAEAMIVRAVEAGAGFFDVAYYNMGPHAENSTTDRLFGSALQASGVARDDIIVCGKLWLWDWPAAGFRDQLEESLERAGLERFDAVVVGDYLDRPEVDEVVAGVDELIADGLVGAWGVNNWIVDDTRAALTAATSGGLVPPSFVQLKYSVVRRSMAEGRPYGELFADGTLGLQASDVLEGGILAGNLAPARKIGADVGGIRERIVASFPEFERIATGFGVAPAQLAVAFCLANPAVVNVLFGASRPAQLEANLEAVELARSAGERIREALAPMGLDGGVSPDGRV